MTEDVAEAVGVLGRHRRSYTNEAIAAQSWETFKTIENNTSYRLLKMLAPYDGIWENIKELCQDLKNR